MALILFSGVAEAQLYMKHPTDVRYIGGNMTNKRPYYKGLNASLNDVKALATSERPYVFWVVSDTVNVFDWDSVYNQGLSMRDSIQVHYVAEGKIKWGGFMIAGTGGGSGGTDIHAPPSGTTTHYSLWTWSGQSGLDTWQSRLGLNADSIDLKLWELIVYTDSVYLYVENDTLKMRTSTITALIDHERPDTTIILYETSDATITGNWTIDGNLTIGTGSLRLPAANNNGGTSRVIWSSSNTPYWSGSGAIGDTSKVVLQDIDTGLLNLDSLITWNNLNQAVKDSVLSVWHSMGFSDSSETIAATVDIWYPVTNVTNNLWSVGTEFGDIVMTGDSMQVTTAGYYEINYNLSFSGANADEYHTALWINNVMIAGFGHIHTGMTASNADGVSAHAVLYVPATHWISVRIMNSANSNDPTLINGDFVIKKLK